MKHISHMMLYCRDQDEARDFYVDKLGFEVTSDVEFGADFRWVTVALPGRPDLNVCLMPTHAGPHPPEIQQRAAELLALGGTMGGIIETDDCRGDYERLRERGVEFTEEPEDRFYGIDCGFRDPSGNPWRLTQPHEVMRDPAEEQQRASV
jgi:catechol 2,3-dioxygenase-like lactoylglutathione lyase family enzyme